MEAVVEGLSKLALSSKDVVSPSDLIKFLNDEKEGAVLKLRKGFCSTEEEASVISLRCGDWLHLIDASTRGSMATTHEVKPSRLQKVFWWCDLLFDYPDAFFWDRKTFRVHLHRKLIALISWIWSPDCSRFFALEHRLFVFS